MEQNRPILLFDGVCNLCNSFVNFVMERDDDFAFASIQSDEGARLIREAGLSPEDLETFVVIDGDDVYTKSRAGLEVLRRLGLPYSLVYPAVIAPRFLRDPVYNLVASNRYDWFGKRDECRVPDDETKDRFLSSEF
jgi:predicted DCC family thiol-disulfide oxidoreductase YuxK